MDPLFLKQAAHGHEILKANLENHDAISALTVDYNDTLTALAASIAIVSMMSGAASLGTATNTKSIVELAFYLGYVVGKTEPDLRLWQNQLEDPDG